MAGIGIEIDLRDLIARVDAVAMLFGPAPEELLDQVGQRMVTQTRNRLDSSKVSPDGVPWDAHSDVYADWLAENFPAGTLLNREGSLLDSIEHQVSGDTLTVGSVLEYARIHQLGGMAGRNHKVNIPARPYLGLGAMDIDSIRAVIVAYYESKLGGAS